MVLANLRIPVGNTDYGLILAIYVCEVSQNAPIRLSPEHLEAGWFLPREASRLLSVKYPKEFTDKLLKLA